MRSEEGFVGVEEDSFEIRDDRLEEDEEGVVAVPIGDVSSSLAQFDSRDRGSLNHDLVPVENGSLHIL